MWRAILWTPLIGLLMGPAIADAAIYGWQDLQGVSHYVSDPEDVPAEYRAQSITVVKDLPLPTFVAASPEPSSARTEEAALPASERVSDPSVETSYEWGYRAGLDAASSTAQNPAVMSIVQNVQVVESAAPTYLYPLGFFGPVLGRSRLHPRRAINPMSKSGFIQGPAGPPPLGAPGPPPVTFIRR